MRVMLAAFRRKRRKLEPAGTGEVAEAVHIQAVPTTELDTRQVTKREPSASKRLKLHRSGGPSQPIVRTAGKSTTSSYFSETSSQLSAVSTESKLKAFRERKKRPCPICLKSLSSPTEPHDGILPQCGHVFCYPCIQYWSTVSRSCPLCKVRVSHEYVRLHL